MKSEEVDLKIELFCGQFFESLSSMEQLLRYFDRNTKKSIELKIHVVPR